MSKQLQLACMFMGKGYGEPSYQHDLEEDTEYADDLVVMKSLVSWASIAVDMVEVGHAFTMEYPDGYEHQVFYEFGGWFGHKVSENEDNNLPNDEECFGCLVELVQSAFDELLTEEQQKRLTTQLEKMND